MKDYFNVRYIYIESIKNTIKIILYSLTLIYLCITFLNIYIYLNFYIIWFNLISTTILKIIKEPTYYIDFTQDGCYLNFYFINSFDNNLIIYILNRLYNMIVNSSSINILYNFFLTYNFNEILQFNFIKVNYINNYPYFLIFNFLFLLTTIISFFLFNYLGLYGIFILNLISILMFWVSIIYYFFIIFFKNIWFFISLGDWGLLYWDYKISFDIIIDTTSLSFLFLTLTIGLNVFIYSFSYFRYEPFVERLLLYINWFILSMNLLVISGNLFVLMLGWEFIGLSSFFLINFWVNRSGTFKSAFKAYSFNKVSDAFLLITIIILFNVFYTIDIITIINQSYIYESYTIKLIIFDIKLLDFISILFFGSIFIKSAQIFGHLWLPDSMEAPVPASALIHSATLVSAGIFLLIRFSPIFELSFWASIILPIIGALTACFGGITASFQSDTKKTLAYSTISHCGFLVLIYTTGVIEFTILYLYIHGFFKATSFLCIGNINRFNKNNQDFKSMGLYYKYLPLDCILTILCLLNLSSLPLTIGFYSKHLLFLSFEDFYYIYLLLYSITIISSLTGVFYSFRLIYNIFFDIKKSKKVVYLLNSKQCLNSTYHTNSSLLSNLIISILFIKSYIIILVLYNISISKLYILSDTITFKILNSFLYSSYSNISQLLNISLLNWIILIVIICYIYIKWRYEPLNNKINNKIYIIFKFILIFFILKLLI